MICPACNTNNSANNRANNSANNSKNELTESCIQCGSDLVVHRLIGKVREEVREKAQEAMLAKKERIQLEQEVQKKSSRLFMLYQIMPSFLLLICMLFALFVGFRLFTVLEQKAAQQTSIANKWSEAGFEHLLQMSKTMQQGVDLILEQRKENQALRDEITQLTTLLNKNQLTHRSRLSNTKEKSSAYPEREENK